MGSDYIEETVILADDPAGKLEVKLCIYPDPDDSGVSTINGVERDYFDEKFIERVEHEALEVLARYNAENNIPDLPDNQDW